MVVFFLGRNLSMTNRLPCQVSFVECPCYCHHGNTCSDDCDVPGLHTLSGEIGG